MNKRKLYFVEIPAIANKGISALIKRGCERRKSMFINLLAAAVSLFLILPLPKATMPGGAVITAQTISAMDMYPGSPGSPGYSNVPQVAISAPADGSIFVAPADILIFAGAVDDNARIRHVDFYQGGELLNTNVYQPYSYTWKNVPAGKYIITVKATSNRGVTGSSVPIYITVIDPTVSGCTCPAECNDRTDISPPFSIDGESEYCWETTSLGQYVYSTNVDTLLINGVDLKNCWTNKLPNSINGKYFIYYKSFNELGHFEMR